MSDHESGLSAEQMLVKVRVGTGRTDTRVTLLEREQALMRFEVHGASEAKACKQSPILGGPGPLLRGVPRREQLRKGRR